MAGFFYVVSFDLKKGCNSKLNMITPNAPMALSQRNPILL